MLTLLFIICFFAVFGKLLMFGIKACLLYTSDAADD